MRDTEIVVDPIRGSDQHPTNESRMSKSKSLFSDVKKQPPRGREEEGPRRKRKVDLKKLRPLVAEVRAGDGIDPRDEARRRSRSSDDSRLGQAHGTHRQEQFLSQVQMAIDSALQTAVTPILNSLSVQDVARYGGSVLVVLGPQDPD